MMPTTPATGIELATRTEIIRQHEQAGRMAEAHAAYLSLLESYPHLADSWFNLARLQRRMGRYRQALDTYQRALDLGLREPHEAHVNRAVIFSDFLNEPAAAERELRRALELAPGHLPALLNLENLCEDLGRREAAARLCEQVLAHDPWHADALARLAGLVEAAAPAGEAMRERLATALGRAGASSLDQATLGFALGRLLDEQQRFDEAFAAYAAANRASRASRPAAIYDRRQQEQRVDDIIATFPRPGAHQPPASGAHPVFICGMFRSGSTLLEQLLAAHPMVRAGGELPYLPALVQAEISPFPQGWPALSPERRGALAQWYRESVARLGGNVRWITDKRPDNFLHAGVIRELFPDARIIVTTRQPLDNCLSTYFLHLDHSMAYALDLLDTGHYWRQQARLVEHWQHALGAGMLVVNYDHLVREPRAVVGKVLEFLDLDWHEGCVQFAPAATAIKTASVWQVRQGLYQRSSGRWRNYASHVVELAKLLDLDLETGEPMP